MFFKTNQYNILKVFINLWSENFTIYNVLVNRKQNGPSEIKKKWRKIILIPFTLLPYIIFISLSGEAIFIAEKITIVSTVFKFVLQTSILINGTSGYYCISNCLEKSGKIKEFKVLRSAYKLRSICSHWRFQLSVKSCVVRKFIVKFKLA